MTDTKLTKLAVRKFILDKIREATTLELGDLAQSTTFLPFTWPSASSTRRFESKSFSASLKTNSPKTMTDLSPAAQATYDAFNRVGLYNEPSFETDRKALAAALRAAAKHLAYIPADSWTRVVEEGDLLVIADELEGAS